MTRAARPAHASLLVACLLALGQSAAGEQIGPETPYKVFAALPYEQREGLITRLSPEAQVTAYLDMLAESEPPDLGLAAAIAPTGQPLVDAVRERLESGVSDLQIHELAFLLFVIKSQGHAKVREDQAALEVLEHRIRCIRDPADRQRGLETLQRIRK